MKKLIIGSLIFMALIGSGYCEGVVRLASGDSGKFQLLKIEAEIKQDSLKRDDRAAVLVFNIVAKVQNVSNKEIELSAYSCSYMDDWITDNKSVDPEFINCKKNGLYAFVLKPGEIYERPLTMRIPVSVTIEDVHFKLGYKAQRMTKGFERIPLEGQPFWSKEQVLFISSDLQVRKGV